jgi:pyridoxal phosphate enzyme (YggS family)
VRRDPHAIRLVAVSKTFSADVVRAAFDAGQRDFGENKVQEALQKMDALTDLPIVWHLIGHLQSNKARKAAARFAWIHSIDDAALLQRVAEAGGGRTIEALVQVDLAGEPAKHGARPDDLPAIFDAAGGLAGVRVRGLMLLPPAAADPEHARRYFAQLRALRDELAARGVAASMLAELSMGMSHDLEVAIEEGATLVRVGSAIFGERAVKPA